MRLVFDALATHGVAGADRRVTAAAVRAWIAPLAGDVHAASALRFLEHELFADDNQSSQRTSSDCDSNSDSDSNGVGVTASGMALLAAADAACDC